MAAKRVWPSLLAATQISRPAGEETLVRNHSKSFTLAFALPRGIHGTDFDSTCAHAIARTLKGLLLQE